MDWQELLEGVGSVINTHLFEVGGTPVSVATVLGVILIVAFTVWMSRVVGRGIERVFAARGVTDEGTTAVVKRLVHYTLLAIGFGIALQTVGVELGALFAAGAVFAVGIGFAMQNIVQNFVSGVILLVERSIKPGDVVDVEGQMVRVRALRIRSTLVRTLDEEEMIVPNSMLVQSAVKNYTMSDSHYRLRVNVGVVYSSDMKRVRRLLEETCESLTWHLKDRGHRVLLGDFGSSSVDFEVSVWIADPWEKRQRMSDLREAIWDALQKESIVIAFPQVDVHFDRPVVDAMAGLSRQHSPAA